MGSFLVSPGSAPAPCLEGQNQLDGPIRTLYQAIDAYTASIEKSASRSEAWRRELARRVGKIKDASNDIPLERFGRDG